MGDADLWIGGSKGSLSEDCGSPRHGDADGLLRGSDGASTDGCGSPRNGDADDHLGGSDEASTDGCGSPNGGKIKDGKILLSKPPMLSNNNFEYMNGKPHAAGRGFRDSAMTGCTVLTPVEMRSSVFRGASELLQGFPARIPISVIAMGYPFPVMTQPIGEGLDRHGDGPVLYYFDSQPISEGLDRHGDGPVLYYFDSHDQDSTKNVHSCYKHFVGDQDKAAMDAALLSLDDGPECGNWNMVTQLYAALGPSLDGELLTELPEGRTGPMRNEMCVRWMRRTVSARDVVRVAVLDRAVRVAIATTLRDVVIDPRTTSRLKSALYPKCGELEVTAGSVPLCGASPAILFAAAPLSSATNECGEPYACAVTPHRVEFAGKARACLEMMNNTLLDRPFGLCHNGLCPSLARGVMTRIRCLGTSGRPPFPTTTTYLVVGEV